MLDKRRLQTDDGRKMKTLNIIIYYLLFTTTTAYASALATLATSAVEPNSTEILWYNEHHNKHTW